MKGGAEEALLTLVARANTILADISKRRKQKKMKNLLFGKNPKKSGIFLSSSIFYDDKMLLRNL